MVGIVLLSRDEFYANLDGSMVAGPASDKTWVRNMILNKKVFVGYKTWESIQQYPYLLKLPSKWVIGELTEPCEIHFGGPASFKKYPPDILIIHRLRTYLKEGLKFECECGKKLLSCIELEDYTEITYQRMKK